MANENYNMDIDLARAGDVTAAMTIIKSQSAKLSEMSRELSKWKVDYEVEVDATTLDVKITARKPFNGGGVIKTISMNDAVYFSNDPSALAEMVADEIHDALLKDISREELRAKLPAALKNVAKMAKVF